MRIVVTGGSGLLGSNLCMELSRLGHEVTALYRQHAIRTAEFGAVRCDIADTISLKHIMAELKPALIVHCAAATDIEWCEAHSSECMRINGWASGDVAATAHHLGVGFVYISTDSVFNGASGGYQETDPVSPVNQYGRSKAAGELAVARECLNALILRVNIYGWNLQSKQSLAEWALTLLRDGRTVPGFSDVVFAPVLVNDLARWIMALVKADCAGVYHVASSDYASKYMFLCALASVFELDRSLVHESCIKESPLSATRPRSTWLRVDKITASIGERMPTIYEGLQKFRLLLENGYVSRLKAAAV